MRSLLRVTFGVGAVSAVGAIAFAALAALVPPAPPAEVAIGKAAAVDDTPSLVRLSQLDGLALLARQRREASAIGGLGRGDAHGIYLVRDEVGAIRAYLGADPRTGCALKWIQVETASGPGIGSVYAWRFHDTCHGSLYDRNGTVVGGPSPWSLDEAVISVRDGIVYASTGDVHPGAWLAGDRSTILPGCDLRAGVRGVGDGRMSILGLRAGAQDFIGQVYSGPFILSVRPEVRVDGRGGAELAEVVSVGDTVCLSFKKQESPVEPVALPGSSWVLTRLSVIK